MKITRTGEYKIWHGLSLFKSREETKKTKKKFIELWSNFNYWATTTTTTTSWIHFFFFGIISEVQRERERGIYIYIYI